MDLRRSRPVAELLRRNARCLAGRPAGRLLAIVVLVCSVLMTGLTSSAAAAVEQAPAFEPAPCPVPVPGARVECGYVQVPESRQDPLGRQLRLLVAVLRSPSAQPEPDPLVVTSGGPGASSAGLLSLARSIYARDRDVVVVEQRGTRWSEPFLPCPEVEQALLATLSTADPADVETGREVAAAKRCAQRLRADGHDLSAYRTAESAADLADVRTALGFDRWNLYGLSYSTRLALTVLRDHPDGLRAVLLDSVSPPETAQYDGQVTGLRNAVDRLAADCAAQQACGRAYPDLQASLVAAARRLDASPLPVDAVSPTTGEPLRLLLTGTTWSGRTEKAVSPSGEQKGMGNSRGLRRGRRGRSG
jgi:pimeloyl-ACP methyl ester carboxylesterase